MRIVTGPVHRRTRRVVGALAFCPQPASQLRRQLHNEAAPQRVIYIPVGHVYDVRPDWNTATEKPELGNRDGWFSVTLRRQNSVRARPAFGKRLLGEVPPSPPAGSAA
jgi:hypothetical protein